MILAAGRQNTIAVKRLRRIEIEHKHQFATHEGQYLIIVFFPKLAHRQGLEVVGTADEMYDRIVPIVEQVVFQFGIIYETPLAPRIFIAPSITLSRKVYPLGMAEFITHKIEVTSLISHKRLVVAFYIGYCLFVSTTVGQLPEYARRLPILVLTLFERLNPVVGYTHGHAIIEAHAAVTERQCQPGHSAHFLGNSDCIGVDTMYQLVGQGQIGNSIGVFAAIVIVAIASESLSETMVIVQHRGHAVKAKTIEMVFFEPVLAVTQQEVHHLILAVIEAQRVPSRVFTAPVTVKI